MTIRLLLFILTVASTGVSAQGINGILKETGYWHLGMSYADYKEKIVNRVSVKLDLTDNEQKTFYSKFLETWQENDYTDGYTFDDGDSRFRLSYGCGTSLYVLGDFYDGVDKMYKAGKRKNMSLRKILFSTDYNVTYIPTELLNVFSGSKVQKLSSISLNSNQVVNQLEFRFYFTNDLDPADVLERFRTIYPNIQTRINRDTETRVVREFKNAASNEQIKIDFHLAGGQCEKYWLVMLEISSI